ncbi:3-methyladenine DNA glycosylase AlkD [Aquimarina spongiae]|uniref:3-methyladenine DNA glycosylase AlkD n=1 Tax=Aquimarina spongiae TaxID=570521 RepID=A0A1M6LC44_9FLAO|nr:3-methyladenine DNA glycosylase AlkD [Aquimarina spongiae]
MDFLSTLQSKLQERSDPNNAIAMKAYMKNRFRFYGVKAPIRKAILKETLISFKGSITPENCSELVLQLYAMEERELHLCAIELVDQTLKKKYRKEDIVLIEKLITTHSWWDTVDFIAKHILGNYLLQFPDEIATVIPEFARSEHMWLNRSAILFQLGYKEQTDKTLLFSLCEAHKSSNEFFIKKAIGWALREYSKVNPTDVQDFVSKTVLKPLSTKEALRRIQG